ncbi:TY-Chap domain-containing protein [Nocardioides montaniterrae]
MAATGLTHEHGWAGLESYVARILSGFADLAQQDKLILEVADGPYVQVCGFDGDQLHAEVVEPSVVSPGCWVRPGAQQWLDAEGWTPASEAHGPNPWKEVPVSDAVEIAADAIHALRELYGVTDPSLVVLEAWGPHWTRSVTSVDPSCEPRVRRTGRRGSCLTPRRGARPWPPRSRARRAR